MTKAEHNLIEAVLAWRRALRVKTAVPTVTNTLVMRLAEKVERERAYSSDRDVSIHPELIR